MNLGELLRLGATLHTFPCLYLIYLRKINVVTHVKISRQ